MSLLNNEISVEKRFWNRVKKFEDEKCWAWLGAITKQGYGSIQIDRKTFLAHRLSYTINKGPIPEGFVIDHVCETKGCVNPSHLEAVSVN